MKTALVTGAGGFIGHHLVKYLKKNGYTVRGLDIKLPEFEESAADTFRLCDMRSELSELAVAMVGVDEVYHLAADMGGMGFISTEAPMLMRNNSLININAIDTAWRLHIPRFFFSSSVCVYRNMTPDANMLFEHDAIPANPDNFYGWEKLYAEQLMQAYAKKYNMEIRIARFENCYGPLGTWRGGREKAPAALCRKVALAPRYGTFEVWGDGYAERVFTYVDDMVAGIDAVMHSDRSNWEGPINLGSTERVYVHELAEMIAKASGKDVQPVYIDGPVGVWSRNFSKSVAHSLGWEAQTSLEEGIGRTYAWIAEQVEKERVRV